MTSVKSNDYSQRQGADDYSAKYTKSRSRPTITELVLYEKQKKEDLEAGRTSVQS